MGKPYTMPERITLVSKLFEPYIGPPTLTYFSDHTLLSIHYGNKGCGHFQ